jgi:homoaconitase/3-isopropylmalate dehydratase large subunit
MAYSKEEQQSIVRQSSLKFLMDYCKLIDAKLSLLEIIKINDAITDYCTNGRNKDMDEMFKVIDKHIAAKYNARNI